MQAEEALPAKEAQNYRTGLKDSHVSHSLKRHQTGCMVSAAFQLLMRFFQSCFKNSRTICVFDKNMWSHRMSSATPVSPPQKNKLQTDRERMDIRLKTRTYSAITRTRIRNFRCVRSVKAGISSSQHATRTSTLKYGIAVRVNRAPHGTTYVSGSLRRHVNF